MAIFVGTAGADSLIGADGEADTFRFTPANLAANDTVIGGGGVALDTLQFTAGGAIAAGAFANVSGIERVQSANAGNSYALTQALVAGAVGTFEARGGTGADHVDGSAVTSGVLFVAGGGADTMIGGSGNDTFSVLAAFAGARHFEGGAGNDALVTNPASWSGSDIFLGESGTDRITFNASGTITAGMLAGLQSVEEIQLGNTLSFDLTLDSAAVAQAGGLLSVVGGAQGAQRVDASAVGAAGRVAYFAGTGADTFLGGAGEDRFEVTEAAATGALGSGDDVLRLLSKLASGIVVDGGAGHDVIELFAGGVWNLANLINFEEIELLAASTITLPATPGFRVLGSPVKDVVTLGAAGQVFFGYAGDDTVVLTPQTLLGAVLNGGSQLGEDTLRLAGAGLYDFTRSAITGFEKIDQMAAPGLQSTIALPATPFDVVLRHGTTLQLGAHPLQTVAGSARADTFTLGAAGQFIDGAGGNDVFVATAGQLAAGTVLVGGAGSDELQVQGGGAADLATGALLLGIERIRLLGNTELTLDVTPGIEITGSDGPDTLTMGAADLTGTLGNGNDLLRVPLGLLAGASTVDGGAGTDTLFLVENQVAAFNVTIPTRFVSFERLDLTGATGGQVTIAGAQDRVVEIGAGSLVVFGGAGAESFTSAGNGNFVSAGDGADTIRQTVAPLSNQVLLGNGGDDLIVYDRSGAGSVVTTMPTTWVPETVRLLGAHSFTTTLHDGLVLIGDPTLGNALTIRGNNQQAIGGSGADTLTSNGGLATTLQGGAGADIYVVSTAHQAQWGIAGQVIQDVATSFVLNRLQITGSGALAIDFHQHTVDHIDRIEFVNAATAANFTLSAAMASTADGNNGGGTGDLFVEALVAMTAGVRLDATGFAADQFLRTLGSFDGADTLLGGAAPDTLAGAGGNDLINAGGGADSLTGDAGADSLIAGEGADNLRGGAGGDQITLTEAAAATDRVRYGSADDGTVDINDAASVNQNTADNITGFAAASDRIVLERAGLGIGAGGIVNVAANASWNIGTGAVFLFESDSANSDTLNSNNHASLTAIEFAINADNGAGFGSSAGRTVALVISNPETQATRTTGVYLWTDADGDSVIEAGDVVRLLAVVQGVTANQMASGASIELI